MKSNGCSGGLSFIWQDITQEEPPFESCCDAHDLAYGDGGSREQRRIADAQLLACVAKQNRPITAILMWAAVRLLGSPYWPGRMRWGRNHKWPYRYK